MEIRRLKINLWPRTLSSEFSTAPAADASEFFGPAITRILIGDYSRPIRRRWFDHKRYGPRTDDLGAAAVGGRRRVSPATQFDVASLKTRARVRNTPRIHRCGTRFLVHENCAKKRRLGAFETNLAKNPRQLRHLTNISGRLSKHGEQRCGLNASLAISKQCRGPSPDSPAPAEELAHGSWTAIHALGDLLGVLVLEVEGDDRFALVFVKAGQADLNGLAGLVARTGRSGGFDSPNRPNPIRCRATRWRVDGYPTEWPARHV